MDSTGGSLLGIPHVIKGKGSGQCKGDVERGRRLVRLVEAGCAWLDE